MTVETLLTGRRRPLSSSEFIDWIAFHSLEPFSDTYRPSCIVAATLANIHRTRQTAFSSDDFMPVERVTGKQMKPEEMKARMASVAALLPQQDT